MLRESAHVHLSANIVYVKNQNRGLALIQSGIGVYSGPMTNLTQLKCKPCEGGTKPLEQDEVTTLLSQVPGWVQQEGKPIIERTFEFPNFRKAMAFVNEVANIANDEDHHPNIEIRYNKVTLTLWTHAIDGLSENDFIVAAKANAIV
jgi:4a-hydroxytetrahydrobiopterin dehydratase